MTSMIPVVTNRVFGLLRGPSVYGYMFSTFGVAALSGVLLVKTLQNPLGYHGMLLICLSLTLAAAALTYLYQFKKLDYLALAEAKGYSALELRNLSAKESLLRQSKERREREMMGSGAGGGGLFVGDILDSPREKAQC